jgi:hypothetical protein
VADTHVFLTNSWIEAARAIREASEVDTSTPHSVRMNLIIIETPDHPEFEENTFRGHMDTTSGELVMDTGHLEESDLTVTVEYDVAKAIFVDQNPQAGMQAFMSGKVKVDGDITKMMAMQNTTPDPGAIEVANKIKDITA